MANFSWLRLLLLAPSRLHLISATVVALGVFAASATVAQGPQAPPAAPVRVLLRVDYHGGHGTIGGTKTQAEELAADKWSFLLWQFGVPAYQPVKSGPGE